MVFQGCIVKEVSIKAKESQDLLKLLFEDEVILRDINGSYPGGGIRYTLEDTSKPPEIGILEMFGNVKN